MAPAASRIADGSRRVVRAAGQAADDAALAGQVKAILMMRKGLDGRHILVSAEEGVVRLSGRVPDAAQKHLAAEAARNSAGVVSVENRLVVGQPR
jgi:osmotically-inducible protein OsmY